MVSPLMGTRVFDLQSKFQAVFNGLFPFPCQAPQLPFFNQTITVFFKGKMESWSLIYRTTSELALHIRRRRCWEDELHSSGIPLDSLASPYRSAYKSPVTAAYPRAFNWRESSWVMDGKTMEGPQLMERKRKCCSINTDFETNFDLNNRKISPIIYRFVT